MITHTSYKTLISCCKSTTRQQIKTTAWEHGFSTTVHEIFTDNWLYALVRKISLQSEWRSIKHQVVFTWSENTTNNVTNEPPYRAKATRLQVVNMSWWIWDLTDVRFASHWDQCTFHCIDSGSWLFLSLRCLRFHLLLDVPVCLICTFLYHISHDCGSISHTKPKTMDDPTSLVSLDNSCGAGWLSAHSSYYSPRSRGRRGTVEMADLTEYFRFDWIFSGAVLEVLDFQFEIDRKKGSKARIILFNPESCGFNESDTGRYE